MPSRHTTLNGIERIGISVANCTPPPKKRRCIAGCCSCAIQCSRTTTNGKGASSLANWHSVSHVSRGAMTRSIKRSSLSLLGLKNISINWRSTLTHSLGVCSCLNVDKAICTWRNHCKSPSTKRASNPPIPDCGNVSCHGLATSSVTPVA